MKAKIHAAFWLIPSFTAIEFPNGKVKGFFIGAHKPRNMKNVPLFGGKPRIEDLKGKGDLVVLDNGRLESFPYIVDDIPRFLAAINALSPDEDLLDECEMLAHRAYRIARARGRTNYVEKNFHDITEEMVTANAARIWKYEKTDPAYRLADIEWIKNGLVYLDRYLTDNGKITGVIKQAIIVGYDKRYAMPVLGFRKSFENFTSIIPLPDKGKSLIASILYTVFHKPSVRFITPNAYRALVKRYKIKFQNFEFVDIDAFNSDFITLRSKING